MRASRTWRENASGSTSADLPGNLAERNRSKRDEEFESAKLVMLLYLSHVPSVLRIIASALQNR